MNRLAPVVAIVLAAVLVAGLRRGRPDGVARVDHAGADHHRPAVHVGTDDDGRATATPRRLAGGAWSSATRSCTTRSAAIQAALGATGAATVRSEAVFGFGFSDGAAIPFAEAADDLLGGEPASRWSS